MHLVCVLAREWEGLWKFIKNWNAGLDPSWDAHSAQKCALSLSLHLPLLWEPSETPITKEIAHTQMQAPCQESMDYWHSTPLLAVSLIVSFCSHTYIFTCAAIHSHLQSLKAHLTVALHFFISSISVWHTHTHTHTHPRRSQRRLQYTAIGAHLHAWVNVHWWALRLMDTLIGRALKSEQIDWGRKRGEERNEVIKGERERNHKSRYTKQLNEWPGKWRQHEKHEMNCQKVF